jgi:beta-N-acetylhexosaminidase
MSGPVVVDVAGLELGPQDGSRLSHPLVGMVILFARNYASPGQLRNLCAQIHALRDPPLLVAVDQEGGRVQRLREGFTRLPPMAELGRLWDREPLDACRAALTLGWLMASELRAHGVDLSFAPVLDLDWARSAVVGDRALHADARVVSLLAGRLCHGMALAGMACCGKHFPGHGWADADSHVALPVDERGLQEILGSDALPYANLGVGLDAVMPAHVVYPKVDPLPAGFSRRWIEEILRGQIGFAGAVFSDDLSMQGARAAGGLLDSARAALAAGCDLVLICNDSAGADGVLQALDWQPPPRFAERFARLIPRGPAPAGPEALRASEAYHRAVRELGSLLGAD